MKKLLLLIITVVAFFGLSFSQIATITTNPVLSGDSLSVCQGDVITFNGATTGGTSPYTYSWDFGDGTTGTGASVTHSYTAGGGYYVTLTSTDAGGNTNTNLARVRIRVSLTPIFSGTVSDLYSICVGTTINLSGTETHPTWSQPIPTTVYAGIYLPDGNGQSYSTSITQTQFAAGQTITTASDISSICINMEHSYLGDLQIEMACPNGSSVVLKPYPNGGSCFLGEPCDNNTTVQGNCYNYCFDMSATMGTMLSEVGNYQYSFTDNAGQSYTNHDYLPAGSYQPENSFAGFIGCPLNGNWTITITDNMSIDDGYLCDWAIHFDPSITPNSLWTIQNTTTNQQWTAGDGLVTGVNPTTATPTIATAPGQSPFTYQITDDFGCTYDTVVNVVVFAAGSANCCYQPTLAMQNDEAVCGKSYTLKSDLENGFNGDWTYHTSTSGVAFIQDPNLDTTNITVTEWGSYTFVYFSGTSSCNSKDSVTITFLEPPIAYAGNDSSLCGDNIVLNANLTTGNLGSWTSNLSGSFSNATSQNSSYSVGGVYGTHTLTWTESNGVCASSAEVKIEFNAIPLPNVGTDDTICGPSYTLNVTNNQFSGYWTSLNGSTPLYAPNFNTPNADVSIGLNSDFFTESFVWVENNGICPGSDTVDITFYREPTANANLASGQLAISCDTLGYLFADTTNSNVVNGLWYSNPSSGVVFDDATANATGVNVAAMNFGTNSNTDVTFYWLAQNGACNSLDSVNITFYESPKAEAGRDTTVCFWNYTGVEDFSIANSLGFWTVAPGAPGPLVFSNNNDPHATMSASIQGDYTIIWTEKNQGNTNCESQDTIIVSFYEMPFPEAGMDTAVCGSWAVLNAIPSVGNGQWVYQSGVGFSDVSHGTISNPQYDTLSGAWVNIPPTSSLFNSPLTFYWRESNNKCVAQDSIRVTFWEDVDAQLVDTNPGMAECGNWSQQLSAINNVPSTGTGYWVEINESPTYAPNVNSAAVDTVEIQYYGMHEFYWVIQNGLCIDSSRAKYIEFFEKPRANAGVSDTICGETYHLHAIPSLGTGRWLNIANTVFSSTGTTYGITPTDSVYITGQLGTYQFIWYEDQDSLLGCGDSDTILLEFAGQPTGAITKVYPALCVGDTFGIELNTSYANPTIFSWDTEVDDHGNIDTTIHGGSHAVISWPESNEESHQVEVITENIFGCKSPIITVTVTEPPGLDPLFTQEEATCGDSTGSAYLTKYLDASHINYYTFKWIDKDTTTGAYIFPDITNTSLPSSDTVQTNLYPGDYTVIVRGLQRGDSMLTYQHYCYDTITVTVHNSGEVIASIDTNISDGIAPYTPTITNTTLDGNKHYWYFYNTSGELVSESREQQPSVTFDEAGEYLFRYIVISKDGCKDTLDYKFINVDAASLLEVPNIFTPNGDGINDIFKVHHKTLQDFHCTIVNRWGKKVYEYSDPDGGWNGQVQGSKGDAASGVYYYFIKATGQDKKDNEYIQYEFKGAFHLIRTK